MSEARTTRPLCWPRSRHLFCAFDCRVVEGFAFSASVEPAGGPEGLPEGPAPSSTDLTL